MNTPEHVDGFKTPADIIAESPMIQQRLGLDEKVKLIEQLRRIDSQVDAAIVERKIMKSALVQIVTSIEQSDFPPYARLRQVLSIAREALEKLN